MSNIINFGEGTYNSTVLTMPKRKTKKTLFRQITKMGKAYIFLLIVRLIFEHAPGANGMPIMKNYQPGKTRD